MAEPCTQSNIAAALKDSLGGLVAQGFSQYADRFEEASVYEIAAAMGVDDPHAARSFLMERKAEPAFPMLRKAVLASLELRIGAATAMRDRLLAVKGDDAPGGRNDRAREAAFRKDPGAYLPGAVPSIRKLTALAFWHVSLDGRLVPCCYVYRAAAVSDLQDMIVLLDDEPYYTQGIVVGAPETERDLAGMVPANITFVAVNLTGGRA